MKFKDANRILELRKLIRETEYVLDKVMISNRFNDLKPEIGFRNWIDSWIYWLYKFAFWHFSKKRIKQYEAEIFKIYGLNNENA